MPAATTLIYDADCAFCQRSLEFGRRHLQSFPAATGYQHADLASYGITREQAERSIALVRPGRSVRHGAAAVAEILRAQPGFGWRATGAAMSVPPIAWLAAGIYALISRYRHRMPGGTASCGTGAAR